MAEPRSPIFLVGYMATGKSTLGRAVGAAAQGLVFVDLDAEVEAAAGASIAQIFATRGEAGFRALEADVLRRVSRPDTVIACGGGTPCHAGNMDFMLRTGTVLHITADVPVIVRRLLEAPPGQRPLVDAHRAEPDRLAKHVQCMLADRAPFYERAHLHFDGNRLETEDEVAEAVGRFFALPQISAPE